MYRDILEDSWVVQEERERVRFVSYGAQFSMLSRRDSRKSTPMQRSTLRFWKIRTPCNG